MKIHFKKLLILFTLSTSFTLSSIYVDTCECPATDNNVYANENWRLTSSINIDETSTINLIDKTRRIGSEDLIPRFTEVIEEISIYEKEKNYFTYTTWSPAPLRKLTCTKFESSIPDGLEWYSYSVYGEYKTDYVVKEENTIKKLECNYCREDDINDTTPEDWSPAPDLYSTNSCTNETIGSIESCIDKGGMISYSKELCCEKELCFIPACNEEDILFKELAINERITFTWTDENLTGRCNDVNGTIEIAKKDCKDTFRCVQNTDELPIEECEPISSYVLPHNGTFHEDISLTGSKFGLHYSSGQIKNNSIAKGWDLSIHYVLDKEESLVSMGSSGDYKSEIISKENNKSSLKIDGKEIVFDENNNHILTKDIATQKTVLTFSYENGRLTSVEDYFGSITVIERDLQGNVISIVAPHGQKTYLDVNTAGDLVEVRYEDNSAYIFEYESHLMTIETEPNGNSFIHIFNDDGKVIKVIDAENGEWNFEYPMNINLVSSSNVIRAAGDAIKYKNHFLNNNVMKSEKESTTGDVVVRESSINDTTSVVTACGQTTRKDYSLIKDPILNKRQLKTVTEETPAGLVKIMNLNNSYMFDSDILLKSISNINLNGNNFSSVRDYNLSTEVTTSAEGIRSVSSFDKKTLLVLSSVYGDLTETNYEYDNLGRLLKEKQGNRNISYSYNNKGNISSLIDVNGDETTYTYDILDRVIEVKYPDNHTSKFSYDKNGNMLSIIVPTPASHNFEYNGVNKKTGYKSPMNKETSYLYDKQRRLTEVRKPSGAYIGYNYNEGRLNSVISSDKEIQYEYSCLNNISSIRSGNEKIEFIYDGSLVTRLSQSGVLNEMIEFSYNNDFSVTSLSYSGEIFNFGYNNDGMLTSSGSYTIERNPLNGLAIKISDNVLSQKRKYNNYGELKEVKDEVYSYSLKRKKLKISSMKDELVRYVPKKKGKGFKKEIIKNEYKYSYDNRGRLIEVKNGKKVVESYSYDSNGNRSSATVNGVTNAASYTLDDNLIVYGNNSYRYSEDGYLEEKTTEEGSTVYDYGVQGELKSVQLPDGKIISYLQNAQNQRVAKLIDDVIVERYLWLNLTTLLAVYDGNDNLVQKFEYADSRMPISMISNGSKYYLHYNHIGSLRAISDASGKIVKEIQYDSYGNIVYESGNVNTEFGFAGGLYDRDTGLTRFGYRDYDSFVGKWTAKDPIGFEGGDTNLYGYVLGDPVNFVDPTGEAFSHYGRNKLNKIPTYGEIRNEDNWHKLHPSKVALHRLGNLLNKKNQKFIHPKGYEAIIRYKDGVPCLVTDDLNMGSYNYYDPIKNPLDHLIVDVIPYIWYGNSLKDADNLLERVLVGIEGLFFPAEK